jgi:hypothetical protein
VGGLSRGVELDREIVGDAGRVGIAFVVDVQVALLESRIEQVVPEFVADEGVAAVGLLQARVGGDGVVA